MGQIRDRKMNLKVIKLSRNKNKDINSSHVLAFMLFGFFLKVFSSQSLFKF